MKRQSIHYRITLSQIALVYINSHFTHIFCRTNIFGYTIRLDVQRTISYGLLVQPSSRQCFALSLNFLWSARVKLAVPLCWRGRASGGSNGVDGAVGEGRGEAGEMVAQVDTVTVLKQLKTTMVTSDTKVLKSWVQWTGTSRGNNYLITVQLAEAFNIDSQHKPNKSKILPDTLITC